mmetsp:Transcript_59313/g.133599  ORF Transcript_59313/g.133599 Transcript_59313/m.133599 type:complete len:200 (-) Transcript_59313:38-637(-)
MPSCADFTNWLYSGSKCPAWSTKTGTNFLANSWIFPLCAATLLAKSLAFTITAASEASNSGLLSTSSRLAGLLASSASWATASMRPMSVALFLVASSSFAPCSRNAGVTPTGASTSSMLPPSDILALALSQTRRRPAAPAFTLASLTCSICGRPVRILFAASETSVLPGPPSLWTSSPIARDPRTSETRETKDLAIIQR